MRTALLLLVGFKAAACASGPASGPAVQQITVAPLPADVKIATATPGMGEKGKWLGAWEGRWSMGLDNVLVVEEVSDTGAKVVISWGSAGRPYNITPAWQRFDGTFDRKVMVVRWRAPGRLTRYELRDDGSIHGLHIYPPNPDSTIVMKRRQAAGAVEKLSTSFA